VLTSVRFQNDELRADLMREFPHGVVAKMAAAVPSHRSQGKPPARRSQRSPAAGAEAPTPPRPAAWSSRSPDCEPRAPTSHPPQQNKRKRAFDFDPDFNPVASKLPAAKTTKVRGGARGRPPIQRSRWTEGATEALVSGVEELGRKWVEILKLPVIGAELRGRKADDLRYKWGSLVKLCQAGYHVSPRSRRNGVTADVLKRVRGIMEQEK